MSAPKRSCPLCDTTPTVAYVKLACYNLDEKRRPSTMVARWGRNFCEPCAAAVYAAAEIAIENAIQRGEKP